MSLLNFINPSIGWHDTDYRLTSLVPWAVLKPPLHDIKFVSLYCMSSDLTTRQSPRSYSLFLYEIKAFLEQMTLNDSGSLRFIHLERAWYEMFAPNKTSLMSCGNQGSYQEIGWIDRINLNFWNNDVSWTLTASYERNLFTVVVWE